MSSVEPLSLSLSHQTNTKTKNPYFLISFGERERGEGEERESGRRERSGSRCQIFITMKTGMIDNFIDNQIRPNSHRKL